MKRWLYVLLLILCLPPTVISGVQAQASDTLTERETRSVRSGIRMGVVESKQCKALVQRDFHGFESLYTPDCKFKYRLPDKNADMGRSEWLSLIKKDCLSGTVTGAYVLTETVNNIDESPLAYHYCIYYFLVKTPDNQLRLVAYYLKHYLNLDSGKISEVRLHRRQVSSLGSFGKPNYLLGSWLNEEARGRSRTFYTVEFFPDGTVLITHGDGKTFTGTYRVLDESRIRIDGGVFPPSTTFTYTLFPSPSYQPEKKFGVNIHWETIKSAILKGVKAAGGHPEYLYPTLVLSSWSPRELRDGNVSGKMKGLFRAVLLLREQPDKEPIFFLR